LLRRRVIGGLAGAVILALLVFGAVKVFGGGDNKPKKAAAAAKAKSTPKAGAQGQVVAQAILAPVGGAKAQGAAFVYHSGQQSVALVRAKLPPSTAGNKYVLWLYNSDKQLVPLAADGTDKQGNFQGAAGLPSTWQNYRFIDVTYQPDPTKNKTVSHGRSVMRGPFTAPTAAAQGATGTGTGTGTGTATGTGTSTSPQP
jgi:hypothetical protein